MGKVAIVGAGIAGIAAGIRLQRKGHEVDVFESNDYPGGKLSHFEKDGFRFDAGPSLFTRPGLVTELFKLCGLEPEPYFRYKRKEVICHYFWEDGKRLVVPADPGLFTQRAIKAFGPDGARIQNYLKKSRLKFNVTSPLFLERSLHKPATYFSRQTLAAILKLPQLDIFRSLHETNSHLLRESHLIQLFNRYATYNGSSPYKTPGIMSLIPYLEMEEGTYFPKGGMISITNSLVKLAQNQGVKFHFSQRVEKITTYKNHATELELSGGNHEADIFICNADIYTSYKNLMPDVPQPEKILSQERSTSALIFYWGIRGKYDQLDLHNIFFSGDYKQEFEHLFERKSLFEDPTVYVNITSKEEKGDAPKGHENWFVMVNAPGDVGQDWETEIAKARKNILKKLQRNLGENIEKKIVSETIMDPRIIERKTNSHNGSLYGTSSNSRYAAFLRHANFSGKVRNLYFCGGSVHPGGGIPLCLYSAKIVADMIPEAR